MSLPTLPAARLLLGLWVVGLVGCGQSPAGADREHPSAAATTAQGSAEGRPPAAPASSVETRSHPQRPAAAPSADAAEVPLRIVDFPGYRAALAKHHGKVVVVDVWATWCVPCVENFPHLVELHQKYAARGLVCVSLNLDNLGVGENTVENALPAVRTFLTEQGAVFENLVSSETLDEMAAADKLGVGQLPAVFVFDRTGELVKLFTPSAELPAQKMYEAVERLVQQLLGAAKG